jgi:glycosyltransferase involved in cell wall biosynthesis
MGKKIAVLATGSSSGETGGAERFYAGLCNSLADQGVDAEIVSVASDESCFEAIEETYLRFYDLDMSVRSTKAPAYLVRHPNHVCYLQHTMRVFYDMFDLEFPRPDSRLRAQRALIQQLDTAALQCPRTRCRFVIGEQVRDRLREYNRLDAEVLHQASSMTGFECRDYDYVFMPGRLHRWKRVSLVIEAMRHVSSPVRLIISGCGEDENVLRRMAKTDTRIVFAGRVTDKQLLNLYADALVVPFVPLREDFGLVTLEAFHSHKPVITCRDSGEPANIVRDGVSGYICEPEPVKIAQCIEELYRNPGKAVKMGRAGAQSIAGISWDKVAARLITSLGY